MQKVKRTLEKALLEAGHLILNASKKPISVAYKSPVNLVTKTDKAAEKMIIEIIKKNFPDHSILAEESSPLLSSPQNGGRKKVGGKWIIDPIDGTTSFAHGVPFSCVSIGYEEDGVLKVGGVWNPFIGEFFFAEKGKGASLNGKKIKVSKAKALGESLLATGFPYDRRQKAKYYLRFVEEFMLCTHGLRRLGSAAMDLCYVACGRFEGYWEFNLQAWDQAAGALIVTEAGGQLTDFRGNPFSIYGTQTLATNGLIHGQMLKIIKKLL